MRGENKRGKVGRACAGCRKAHLRCDMKRPCERCQKRGLECVEAPLTKPPKSSSTSAPKTPKTPKSQKKRKEPSPETTPEESNSPIPTPTVTREKKKRHVQSSSTTSVTTAATTSTSTTTATTTQKKDDPNQACLQDKYVYVLNTYQNALNEKMNQFYSFVSQKVSLEPKSINLT